MDNLIRPNFQRANYIWKHQGFQKYLRNTGWMMSGRFISLIVTFLTTIYVVRYLGPENYGALSYAISFVAIFGFIASLGIDTVLYRDLIKFPEKINEYLGSAFLIKLFAGLFATLSVSIITFFITPGEFLLNIAIIIIASAFIFQPFHIIRYYFQSKVQSKFPSIVNVVSSVTLNLLKIIIILSNQGVLYLSLVFLAEAIFIGLLFIFFYKKQGLHITDWKFNKEIAKQILIDSWPFIFFGAFSTIYARIDQIMIQNYIDTASVGLYDAAVRLTEVWYFIPTIILASVFPAVVNSQNDKKQYRKRLIYMFLLMAILPITISLIIFNKSELITNIVYGSEFIETAKVLNIYTWSLLGSFLGYAAIYYLLAENNKKVMFLMSFITVLVNIVLNIYLIPQYGIVGAAWATVISYTITPLVPLFFIKIKR